MRKDKDKPGPSGMSRNEAFSLPEKWGGRDCLLKIDDLTLIKELKEAVGGEDLLAFVSKEFSDRAQAMYDTLGIEKLTGSNIWDVFRALYPLVFPM